MKRSYLFTFIFSVLPTSLFRQTEIVLNLLLCPVRPEMKVSSCYESIHAILNALLSQLALPHIFHLIRHQLFQPTGFHYSNS